MNVGFGASDPDGLPVAWDVRMGRRNGTNGWCCFTGGTLGVRLDQAGVYRFSAHALDRELLASDRPSQVVRIGGATGEPPLAAGSLSPLSGPVPFQVQWDLSASHDPDGTVQTYCVNCNNSGFFACTSNPAGSCTFDLPGAYWIDVLIQDDAGDCDALSLYAVATPAPGGGDTTPPAVAMIAPADGAAVSGEVALAADATDAGSGVARVDFLLDGATLLGSDASAPFALSWDSGSTPPGAHQLHAIACDGAGNSGASAPVEVTVAAPAPPAAAITSPAHNSIVPRRTTVTIQASATPGSYPVGRVEFFVNGALTCTDTSAPYSCAWRVPAKGGRTYTLLAHAIDAKGAIGVSPAVTVGAK